MLHRSRDYVYTFQVCWFGVVFVRQSRSTSLLCRAWLVPGWPFMGLSHMVHTISVFNQPPRSAQPGHPFMRKSLNSFSNRTSPSDNSNDHWKRLCLVSLAAAPCVWMLRELTRNLLTYLLTYLGLTLSISESAKVMMDLAVQSFFLFLLLLLTGFVSDSNISSSRVNNQGCQSSQVQGTTVSEWPCVVLLRLHCGACWEMCCWWVVCQGHSVNIYHTEWCNKKTVVLSVMNCCAVTTVEPFNGHEC